LNPSKDFSSKDLDHETTSSAAPPSNDPQASVPHRKRTAQDTLKTTWHGIELLLKKAEACLEGTPAKAPVALVNALIAIKNV